MKKKKLITSALPYVNNIPHLGNLIQVLSADVFARFCRNKGYETLYVCGTDEYGTATETRALEEGVTPKELCDHYHKIHTEIYDWFNIKFDKWGRTSTPEQTEIVQHIFNKCDEAGLIREDTISQLYCESCDRFLADRYVLGECPSCGSGNARGDQCEDCGKLLDPTELIHPKCSTCGSEPVLRETKHLYLNLPKVLPKLQKWMDTASVNGFWARNALQMTKSWIRDGLKERCITRDLKWGIPVPKEGFEGKVFYVWFDAPIGYISITMTYTKDWEYWWRNPEEVELFQFIGKDNIPFHTVIFPSSLLGTGEKWTMLHHMSSTEYLNYEDGKFSKSKGIGVFGTDARDTGIPSDVWRFYIFYNRPEKSDYQFSWHDFQERVNSELLGNLGNLVNRTLVFVNKFYDSRTPEAEINLTMLNQIKSYEAEITDHFEKAQLRDALRRILALSSFGNKSFQEGEPWRTRISNPVSAAALIKMLVYLVRDLAIMIEPYIPETSAKITQFLGNPAMTWESLGDFSGVDLIGEPEILFNKLENDFIIGLKEKFAGSQAERAAKEMDKGTMEEKLDKIVEEKTLEEQFVEKIDLRVAKITAIERHPEADKLYIETIDVGEEEPRQIVSGLVPYYKEEELLNHNIILVYNLKPAKLRGVKSQGMLLAADNTPEGSDERADVEVLFADWAEPGTRINLAGMEVPSGESPKKLKANHFFNIPLKTVSYGVKVGDTALEVSGKALQTNIVADGEVG
ncbi:MAG: methionine--tRNA ligase [Spirochaetaceae bacterium]|nr:methionine--tRNA ligase [Spirochaetaceae bacterium]